MTPFSVCSSVFRASQLMLCVSCVTKVTVRWKLPSPSWGWGLTVLPLLIKDLLSCTFQSLFYIFGIDKHIKIVL